MVVYVRIEPEEKEFLKSSVRELNSLLLSAQTKALDYSRLRQTRKREIATANNKLREIHGEIDRIKLMMPSLEEKKPMAKLIIKPGKPTKKPTTKYEAELEELSKKIAALK
jgi:hypothetical protein